MFPFHYHHHIVYSYIELTANSRFYKEAGKFKKSITCSPTHTSTHTHYEKIAWGALKLLDTLIGRLVWCRLFYWYLFVRCFLSSANVIMYLPITGTNCCLTCLAGFLCTKSLFSLFVSCYSGLVRSTYLWLYHDNDFIFHFWPSWPFLYWRFRRVGDLLPLVLAPD